MSVKRIILDCAFIAAVVFCLYKAYDTITPEPQTVIRAFAPQGGMLGAFWEAYLELKTDTVFAARTPITITATLTPDRTPIGEPRIMYLFFPDAIDPELYKNGIIKRANVTLHLDDSDGKYRGSNTMFYQSGGSKTMIYSSTVIPILPDDTPGTPILLISSEESRWQFEANNATLAFAWVATGLAIAASYSFVNDVRKNLAELLRKKGGKTDTKRDGTDDKPDSKRHGDVT